MARTALAQSPSIAAPAAPTTLPELHVGPAPASAPRAHQTLRTWRDPAPPAQYALQIARPAPAGRQRPLLRRREAGRADLSDPGVACAQLARAIVEALSATRPVAQLSRWLAGPVYHALARRARLHAGACATGSVRPMIRVRRVRVCAPCEAVAECAAVVHDGTRLRALAIRLEWQLDRWQVTALEIG